MEHLAVPGRQAPAGSANGHMITCTQLVTRFDRNRERPIGLALLRRVRAQIRRDMRDAGARGSMVWRLARTPSGITITGFWHPLRQAMIELARPIRLERNERRARLAGAGVVNRRRTGAGSVPHASFSPTFARTAATWGLLRVPAIS
jgi:hypothetical protein